MHYWVRIVLQITLLWLIYVAGNFVIQISHLPIPGNVLGMIFLLILLLSGIVPITWFEEGADLLLKHLAFFFIPIAVGLMEWGGLLQTSGIQLLLVILLGTGICIIVTGLVAQFLAGNFSTEEDSE